MEKEQLFKVMKIMKKSGRQTLIEKNLTEEQARRLVATDEVNNPDAIKYMWCYYKM
jgi:hypothetical protein